MQTNSFILFVNSLVKAFELQIRFSNQPVSTVKSEALKVLQAMSPAQKLRAAERLYHSAWQLKAAALRAEHPDWTEEAIRHAVRMIFLYARS